VNIYCAQDLAAARSLSEELGAKGFRERSWHE
jgi:hypothetical protein